MKKNITKLGAMALVGIMGMGLATTPVSAAAQKTTDVFYTTSSAGVDADGKVVMVVPAAVNLTKANAEKEFAVRMQTSDPTSTLPDDFTAKVSVESTNKGKLKTKDGSKEYEYKMTKDGQEVSLATKTDFNTYQASGLGGTASIEKKAIVKVEKDSVDKMENENPGTVFMDTLTFTVDSYSGTGLK